MRKKKKKVNKNINTFWNDRIAILSNTIFLPTNNNLILDDNNFNNNKWFNSIFFSIIN